MDILKKFYQRPDKTHSPDAQNVEKIQHLQQIVDQINNHQHRDRFVALLILQLNTDPGHGEYHNPYPLETRHIQNVFKRFPTPQLYFQEILNLAYDMGSHHNLGVPVRKESRERFQELGKIIYADDWERAIDVPRRKRRSNAFKSSKQYKEKNSINSRIPDGFVDVGRTGQLSLDANVVKTQSPIREILIVDRLTDIGLQELITEAKKIQAETQDSTQALFLIAQLIRNKHITNDDLEAWHKKHDKLLGDEIFIGDYEGKSGYAGVCRHLALLFHVVASDLGYKSTLLRGFVEKISANTAHVWCEVSLNGKKVVVDLSSQGRKYDANYEHFKAVGGFPIADADKKKSNHNDRTQYFDVDGNWLYSAEYFY